VPVRLFRLIFIIVLLSFGSALAYNVDGRLSTAYEISKDKGDDYAGLWENYLSIDNAEIISPYLGLNFYGRFAVDEEESESYSDIYSAYLEFSSFQKAVEAKLGRFSYIGNRFLTLDGAEVTVRTDKYLGFTMFAGEPAYFDADGRHINESFRHTGDKLYGGKVFLNGVKNTTGFLSYSKETEDSDVLQEFVGAGLGGKFSAGEAVFNLDGRLEYDTQENAIYKSAVRFYTYYKKLMALVSLSSYNVEDGSSYENELVISNFSTGEEDRYAYTIQYKVNEHYKPYQSTVFTRLEMPSGLVAEGEIYKLGLEVDYFKTRGITSNIEAYLYESGISNAKGGSFVFDWNVFKELKLSFESEMLRLENSKSEQNIYSIYLEAEYMLMKDVSISAYAENNKETRYLPENRYGIKAAYSF
jgi:hypothetical protein